MSAAPPAPQRPPILLDRFEHDAPRGLVDATHAADSTPRLVTDAEGALSIDHGSLRIATLATPGWGRAALAYGPFSARPGLALAVAMLNGHNTSQTLPTQGLLRQAYRFLRGGNSHAIVRQLAGLARYPAREGLVRRLTCWRGARRAGKGFPIDDNLRVGLFHAGADPLGAQAALVMHAASQDCGELRFSRGNAQPAVSLLRGVQNVEAMYVVALRERGAIAYIALPQGARGGSPAGTMRPVAIDLQAGQHWNESYAALHQSVLGEIGFAVDSRVRAVAVDHIESLAARFAGAHAADTPDAPWTIRDALRVQTPDQPTGLVHALWTARASGAGGLAWRVHDEANYWRLRALDGAFVVECVEHGQAHRVASGSLPGEREVPVLILDDGRDLAVRVASAPGEPAWICDDRLGGARGVGLVHDEHGQTTVREWEAHPRHVPIPASLPIFRPWTPAIGRELARDSFRNAPGPLEGRPVDAGSSTPLSTDHPAPAWERTLGPGSFVVRPEGGARIVGRVGSPSPGRTLYTIPWSEPGFAELEATMTPPGSARGQKHEGRGGLVFWQDRDHYLIVNLWLHDGYAGASISSFPIVGGFDDIYNAVWSNIGSRATWGRPFRLGVVFDGDRYIARVDGEPVIMRAISDVYPRAPRLRIRRVGLAANWEWGLDTGTVFHEFLARGQA